MTPSKAKKIIESLANGIDPETGMDLPEYSLLNNPDILRALFIAAAALEKIVKRESPDKPLPENAEKPWSESEDKELLAEFEAKTTIEEMAERHTRSKGGIAFRLVRLGCITDRRDAYPQA